MRNFHALLQEIDQLLESPPNTPKPSSTREGDQPADAAIEQDELLASLTRHFGHTGFRATQREISHSKSLFEKSLVSAVLG